MDNLSSMFCCILGKLFFILRGGKCFKNKDFSLHVKKRVYTILIPTHSSRTSDYFSNMNGWILPKYVFFSFTRALIFYWLLLFWLASRKHDSKHCLPCVLLILNSIIIRVSQPLCDSSVFCILNKKIPFNKFIPVQFIIGLVCIASRQ